MSDPNDSAPLMPVMPADVAAAVGRMTDGLKARRSGPVKFRLRNRFQVDLAANIIDCASRELPEVTEATEPQGPALVVAKGPSLADPETWAQVLRAAEGATVFAVKDNAEWLRARGLNPRFVINADQRPDLAERVPVDPSLTYLLASCCHPSLFDRLLSAGCEVRVWHFACGVRFMGRVGERSLYRALFREDWVAESGSAIGNRAIPLLYRMGFDRPPTLAGVDFGARDLEGEYYADGMPGRPVDPLTRAGAFVINDGGILDGRTWYSRPDLVVSARAVAGMIRGGWVRVIGDSLASALAAKSEAEAIDAARPKAGKYLSGHELGDELRRRVAGEAA